MSIRDQVPYSDLIIERRELKVENDKLRIEYVTIKEPIKEDGLKPTSSIKSRVQPGSMDWLYEV